jgi:hypothetical protein
LEFIAFSDINSLSGEFERVFSDAFFISRIGSSDNIVEGSARQKQQQQVFPPSRKWISPFLSRKNCLLDLLFVFPPPDWTELRGQLPV